MARKPRPAIERYSTIKLTIVKIEIRKVNGASDDGGGSGSSVLRLLNRHVPTY